MLNVKPLNTIYQHHNLSNMSTRPTYDIATFYDHEVQWLLALFCTKPELYEDHQIHRYKQDYFFARFRKFAADYYNFSGDDSVYFDTARKETAGEANICGGAGKQSGASSRYFKNRYRGIEESREKRIDDFAKKYVGISFEVGKYPRLFLGVTEIWNKLARIEEILAVSKWADVRERSYDDASFVAPFPKKLEKDLIPHEMRNRAMQKFRAAKSSSRPIVAKKTCTQTEIDEEEREFLAARLMESVGTVVPLPKIENAKIFVMPEGIDDDW